MKYLLSLLLVGLFSFHKPTPKPNILIIYADDLGYGDVSAYKKGTLPTPNIDKLAQGGIRFTNGYSTSATCTPSRFALLTGKYPWKTEGTKVLPGDAPLLIDTASMTVPKLLKKAGYQTGVVGKWHLGLGNGALDWNKSIAFSPNDIGFDYSYIMAATNDRVPTVFVENRKVVGLDAADPIYVNYKQNFEGEPTAISNPELLTKLKWHFGHNFSVTNGVSRIGYMKGGKSALWVDEDMADVFLSKAKAFIDSYQPSKTGKPFFLYYALHEPHVPRVPHARFVGKSGMGPRGDAILEADWCVGEIMKKLDKDGLLENTLVIFSSDNGPVLDDGYYDDAAEKLGNHTPAGGLRGGKYSLYEAGTRVPFITYWKGKIKPAVSNAVLCQLDFASSFAQLIGAESYSTDSQNLLNAILGKSKQGRANLVLEASGRLAFREGNFIMIPPYKGPAVSKEEGIELGNSSEFQLYDLSKDLAQKNNLAKQFPQRTEEMKASMKKIAGNKIKFD
jgi:arylsulfatase A-like enzyme